MHICDLLYVIIIVCACVLVCMQIDMHLCSHLLPVYMYTNGMTLHVVWHLGAGYGGYLVTLILAITRANALGVEVKLLWMWHIIPLVTKQQHTRQKDCGTGVKKLD